VAKFSVLDTYSKAVSLASHNIGTFLIWALLWVGIIIIFFFVSFLAIGIGLAQNPETPSMAGITLVQILAYVVEAFMGIGLIRLSLQIVDGKNVSISEALPNSWKTILWFFLAGLMYGCMLLGGFLVFILPAFYIALRFWMFPFVIADRNEGPIRALEIIAETTKGNLINLLLLSLVTSFFNVVAILTLGIGWIITIPATHLSFAIAYRAMSSENNKVKENTPQTSLEGAVV